VTHIKDQCVKDLATKLGRSWPKKGNCNRDGDLGDMFGAGTQNAATGLEYAYTSGREDILREVTKVVADWAENEFGDTLQSIQKAEEEKGEATVPYIDKRVGSTVIQSMNLVNAAHIDVNDNSRCLSILRKPFLAMQPTGILSFRTCRILQIAN
jgi:hypothetical protein